MSLLADMMTLREVKEDLSKLPKDVMSAIKKNIRKGAEDLEQKWANALELVQKAYEVEGIQRPNPTMESAWKQYEENLQYAVQQLAENRGMEDDWRMSSSMFHEALNHKSATVTIEVGGKEQVFETSFTKVEDLADAIHETIGYGVEVDGNELTLSKWGIKQNLKIRLDN